MDNVNDNQQAQQDNTQQAKDQSQQQNNATVDYDKLESIVSKGIQQKESAVLKSFFEQQGMTEDEVKQAVTSYKSERAKKSEEEKNAHITAQQELEQLRAQVRQSAVNSKATEIALDMGIDKNSMPYLIKMADLSKAVNDKNEVSEDVIRGAFEQVLKDVPALKAINNNNAGFQIGANNDNAKLEDDMLRKAAGLSPRKK